MEQRVLQLAQMVFMQIFVIIFTQKEEKLFKLTDIKQKEECKYLIKLEEALKKIYEQGEVSEKIKNKIYKLLNNVTIKIEDANISKST